MSRIFVIFGAGELGTELPVIPKDAFIIAADAGLRYLEHTGIVPDLIVGDFDSLGSVPTGTHVITHRPEKEDTDMMLAIREALARNAEIIVIFGGMGGRPDHEYANIQALAYIANAGCRAYLIGRGIVCTVIKNSHMDFSDRMRGTLSVFCHGAKATGVYLRGLKYPLTDHTLTSDYPLGVSNEFTAVPSSVSVREGLLLIMWEAQNFGITDFN